MRKIVERKTEIKYTLIGKKVWKEVVDVASGVPMGCRCVFTGETKEQAKDWKERKEKEKMYYKTDENMLERISDITGKLYTGIGEFLPSEEVTRIITDLLLEINVRNKKIEDLNNKKVLN